MNFTGKELKGELIISDYINHSIPLIRYSLLLFVLIPFIGTISNFQLWSGTLISGISSNQEVKFRKIGMVVFTVCSIVWSLSSESVWGIVQYLFVISAGVGPVFILRWYWHKITAKVQFIAMLSSLVYANLYIILEKNWIQFAQFSNDLSIRANLTPYFFQVFVVTVAVVFTWLFVALLNKTDTKQAFNRFDAYSKGLEALKSKSNWSAFVFLAILIVSSRIFSWYLVIGEFLIATAFSLIMLFCLILYAYRLNKNQAQFDVKT
jgi:solute:Na+ symporter, SSS family